MLQMEEEEADRLRARRLATMAAMAVAAVGVLVVTARSRWRS